MEVGCFIYSKFWIVVAEKVTQFSDRWGETQPCGEKCDQNFFDLELRLAIIIAIATVYLQSQTKPSHSSASCL